MNDIDSLKAQVMELKCAYERCNDEKSKLGVMYETACKEKEALEKRIMFLEGSIEAYKYCVRGERR